jgi:hypothetical protein
MAKAKRSRRKTATCPNCERETAQVVECPRCRTAACVEFCIPGGVGTICVKCEEEDD